jgi:hypothetical protein
MALTTTYIYAVICNGSVPFASDCACCLLYKGSSSKRLSEKGVLGFAWQNGYGTFSVSESSVEAVTAYISDQAEDHRKFSYQEELRELLKRHRVPGLKPMGYSVFALRATQNVQTCRQDDSILLG